MKRILAALLVSVAASACVVGQTPQEPPKSQQEQAGTPQQEQARAEIEAGKSAFKANQFLEAQRHYERALELDPDNKDVRMLIARAVHGQFRQGDTSPENLSKAEEAVAAYKRALEHDPANEDAYNAVGHIYHQTGDREREREWVLARATSPNAPAANRATAYTALSVKEWQCSRDITERRENKKSTQGRGPTAYVYVRPQKAEDFERARGCATRGLQYAEEAVGLAPEFSHAWASKANLLRELGKLAQMEGDEARKAAYDQQADAAAAEQRRAASAAAQKRAEEERQRAEAAPAAASDEATNAAPTAGAPRRPVVSGGVLNEKAVSKPQPVYPHAAREARAEGTVTVMVMVDEEGAVTSARAVAGHPLLQQAAVDAARQARFAPTLQAGRPARVTGVLTYEFVLQ